MVDHSKIPFQLIKTPDHIQREKARQIAWKKLKIPDTPAGASIIKAAVRKGIPDIHRGEVYIGITGSGQLMKSKFDFYENTFQKVYGSYSRSVTEKVKIESVDPRMIAEFGGKIYQDLYCCLNEKGIKTTKRILCVVADQNPDVDYCPQLPEVGM